MMEIKFVLTFNLRYIRYRNSKRGKKKFNKDKKNIPKL